MHVITSSPLKMWAVTICMYMMAHSGEGDMEERGTYKAKVDRIDTLLIKRERSIFTVFVNLFNRHKPTRNRDGIVARRRVI